MEHLLQEHSALLVCLLLLLCLQLDLPLLREPGTQACAAFSAAADTPCCSSAPPGSPRTHSYAR
jgi:hypothetical protein